MQKLGGLDTFIILGWEFIVFNDLKKILCDPKIKSQSSSLWFNWSHIFWHLGSFTQTNASVHLIFLEIFLFLKVCWVSGKNANVLNNKGIKKFFVVVFGVVFGHKELWVKKCKSHTNFYIHRFKKKILLKQWKFNSLLCHGFCSCSSSWL